ncbi:MAG: insulinase family protein [Kiritimatiellia bacterium]|nr:insulinase family protein [Kiritimatiellia bacterium]
MTQTHGFELLETRNLAEYRSKAFWYRHLRTGAELLSIINDDENKVFGVTFRTPPPDSTGVAHILEHSVLCGSEKYPLKEPFVELLKGSLHTFLNAMTYPDKTVYPVASTNLRDFRNLVDVYIDAVFHPRLTPRTLAQEGWHYELPAPDGPLTIQGVVYNEMKGVYSSPDSLLGELSQQALFPDTLYGLDSGGDPDVIPSLTFEQFFAFHQRYYHPSNARFFFAGDDDPEDRLRRIDAALAGFDRINPNSLITLQARFPEPRRAEEPFPVDPASPDADKGFVTLNWLLPEPDSAASVLTLGVLAQILIGTPASPLRKALIDSGLGEDLAHSGLDSQLRQMTFSVGLRGILPDDADSFEALVFDTLRTMAQEGADPDLVAAAINTIEFSLRENNTGRFPRGLALMLRAATSWLHDGSPFTMLEYEKPLAELKIRMEEEPRLFSGLIQQHLLDSPHRVRLVLRPDPALAAKREATEKARLSALLEKMSPTERAAVQAEAEALRTAQAMPDSPEALLCIPSLSLADLETSNRLLPCEEPGPRLYRHDLFTGGLVYLDVGFPLRALPARLLPYTSLFGRILFETGVGDEDFVAFTNRIGRLTGGVGAGEEVVTRLADGRASPWLLVSGKATVARTGELCDVLKDALLQARLQDSSRIGQMILEEKADLESGLVPSGNRVVGGRLDAGFSESGWIHEQTGGVDYLQFIRDLADRAQSDWSGVQADLAEIRDRLIRREGLLINFTADKSDWPVIQAALDRFQSQLPEGCSAEESWNRSGGEPVEALAVPAAVFFVGEAFPLFNAGYAFHGSALVAARYLSMSWLWDRIRVQGGAYGAGCRIGRITGVMSFSTYRDPNLERSLDAFAESASFLKDRPLDEKALERAVIGAIGEWDAYRLPDAKGRVSMIHRLMGDDEASRQRLREEILGTRPAHFRELGEKLAAAIPAGRIAVLGPESAGSRLESRLGRKVSLRRIL